MPRAATVNGAAGAVVFIADRPVALMGFVVRDRRIAAIDVLANPPRLATLVQLHGVCDPASAAPLVLRS